MNSSSMKRTLKVSLKGFCWFTLICAVAISVGVKLNWKNHVDSVVFPSRRKVMIRRQFKSGAVGPRTVEGVRVTDSSSLETPAFPLATFLTNMSNEITLSTCAEGKSPGQIRRFI